MSCVLDRVRLSLGAKTTVLRGRVALEIATMPPRLVPGDVVAARGIPAGVNPARNPGQWDKGAYDKAHGIVGRVWIGKDGRIQILSRGHFSAWEAFLHKVASRWETALEIPSDALQQSQATRVLKGMILGERAGIDPGVQDSFIRTNTLHILAISGQQLTLIFLILFGVLRALGLSQRTGALICIPAVILYGAVVGWQPSVARAVIMIALVLTGLAFDRKVRLLRMLALAAIVLLIANPDDLFDVGFQLSFLAVLFLIAFAGPLSAWMKNRLPGWEELSMPWWKKAIVKFFFPLLSASLVCWLASGPLTAWRFQWFSPITLIANLLIVGWVSLVTIPLGFISVLLGSIWIALAYPFNVINAISTQGLITMAHFLAAIPYGSLRVAAPGEGTLIFYYAFFAAAAWFSMRAKSGVPAGQRATVWVLAILAALTVASHVVFTHRLECVFFDVGQGDAIFVRFPNGENMLVDGGPGGFGTSFDKTLEDYMRSIGATKIDHLVMTHPHADHIGGLPAVLSRMEVGELVGNGRAFPSLLYRKLLVEADAKKVPLRLARGPSAWLKEAGARVEILFPDDADIAINDKNENEHSVVLALHYEGRTLLLTGDVERRAETQLCAGGKLRADVLKVPHHGGNTSCTHRFLDRIRGRWAVISTGAGNKFGHPAPEVLTRLRERGWNIFRTDQDGGIMLRGYGGWWTLRTVASRRHAIMLP